MIIAPDHVRKYCKKNVVTRKKEYENEMIGDYYSFVYQIICTCGCEAFDVYKNQCPYVYAICKQCNKKIVIYDLKYYPAAAIPLEWYPSELEFIKIETNNGTEKIIVNYDYDDEYAITDNRFDMNNITGFNMWTYSDGIYKLIVDDETA